jgi:hypothetical protein
MILVIIIGILSLILIIYFLFRQIYNGEYYIDKNYINDIINNSIFFDRMTEYDLYARKINSIEEYKKHYTHNIVNFNYNNVKELEKYVKEIDNENIFIEKINLSDIKWKFIKINSKIEEGFPHTLGDVIVLSDSFFNYTNELKKEVLIHEKIHVFQRLYPIETHNFIKTKLNLNVIDNIKTFKLARNNPDIDGFMYTYDNKHGFIQLYNNDKPYGLKDSDTYVISLKDKKIVNKINKYIGQYEHPFEIMASGLSKNPNLNDFHFSNIIY